MTRQGLREIIGGIGAYSAELRRAVPAVMQGFGALAKAASAPARSSKDQGVSRWRSG